MVFKSNAPTASSAGDYSTASYTTVATVWGQIVALSGKEITGDRDVGITSYTIIIRYRSDVTSKMLITHDGTDYRIVSLFDRSGKKHYLHLKCEVDNG